jgi:hypothetical protein
MPKAVWRLRGSTDRVVEGFVEQTASKVHAVSVVLGQETFLHEVYPDEAGAMRRAAQVRKRLLKGGGWIDATDHVVASRR